MSIQLRGTMNDLNIAYARLLHFGLLIVRQALDEGDLGWAQAEVTMLHNVPSLIEEPNVELRPIQFLYRDDEGFHFMDTQSYEQFALTDDDLGDLGGFLKDGMGGIRSVLFNDKVISVEIPNTVVLQVVDTAPAVKGATAQAQTKPATLETGIVIQVPSYLESGELVQVDTREARFIARAK